MSSKGPNPYKRKSRDEISDEISDEVISRPLKKAKQINEFNELLVNIIKGPEDDTIPPEAAAITLERQKIQLFEELDKFINTKVSNLEAKQQRIREAERESMSGEEVNMKMIIDENTSIMNKLNDFLSQSDERLNREERLKLHNKILKLINDTISNYETISQLKREPYTENIKQLFNSLIKYYTEMASYGYEQAPEALAKMGSLIAGSAIIGSSIYSSTEALSSNNSLVYLARFLPRVAAAGGAGVYFLERAGLPVKKILNEFGEQAVSCVQGGCQQLFNFGLKSLEDFVESDSYEAPSSSGSSASSGSSGSSTAEEAGEAIQTILNILDKPTVSVPTDIVIGENDQLSQLTESPGGISPGGISPGGISPGGISPGGISPGGISPGGISPGSLQRSSTMPLRRSSTIPSPPEELLPGSSQEKGGKRRKSRHHNKFKKSKRRIGKKVRMTKKGKKHHKTLKRYRTKMSH